MQPFSMQCSRTSGKLVIDNLSTSGISLHGKAACHLMSKAGYYHVHALQSSGTRSQSASSPWDSADEMSGLTLHGIKAGLIDEDCCMDE